MVIPYGGGGLTVGIASAVKALRPDTKIFTAEPETAAALAAALAAGHPAEVDYQPSFVDGSGSRRGAGQHVAAGRAARRRRAVDPGGRGR